VQRLSLCPPSILRVYNTLATLHATNWDGPFGLWPSIWRTAGRCSGERACRSGGESALSRVCPSRTAPAHPACAPAGAGRRARTGCGAPRPLCLTAHRSPGACAGHATAPRRWADTLALELAAAAHRHPLLSGFYRMLAATTRTAVRAGLLPEAAPAGGAAAAGPVCQQVGVPCSALPASGGGARWHDCFSFGDGSLRVSNSVSC
jgi:hypothetical protein